MLKLNSNQRHLVILSTRHHEASFRNISFPWNLCLNFQTRFHWERRLNMQIYQAQSFLHRNTHSHILLHIFHLLYVTFVLSCCWPELGINGIPSMATMSPTVGQARMSYLLFHLLSHSLVQSAVLLFSLLSFPHDSRKSTCTTLLPSLFLLSSYLNSLFLSLVMVLGPLHLFSSFLFSYHFSYSDWPWFLLSSCHSSSSAFFIGPREAFSPSVSLGLDVRLSWSVLRSRFLCSIFLSVSRSCCSYNDCPNCYRKQLTSVCLGEEKKSPKW